MPTNDGYTYYIPSHGEWFIPSLLHSPEPAPDLYFRHRLYEEFGKQLLKPAHNDPYQGGMLRIMARALNGRIDETVAKGLGASKGLGATAWDDILASANLLDKTFGSALAGTIEPRIAKLRPQSRAGSFGSKGQFPIIQFDGAVEPKQLIDVRVDPAYPAMITHTLIDPKNRYLLWLILQPYQDWDFKLQQPHTSETPVFVACQPWLLAIDCRDGHTVHKINLGNLPGLWPNGSPETMSIGMFDQPIEIGMVANDTHLLLQIHWAKRMYSADSRIPDRTLISINRETADIEVFPRKMHLLNDTLDRKGSLKYGITGMGDSRLAGMGDSFFIVEWLPNQPGDSIDLYVHRLWQFQPGAEPKLLAQSSRRPGESPFDANDQKVRLLRAEGQRLLVASSWEHFAYYNPAQARWEDAPVRRADEWKNYVDGIDTMTYRANLTPYDPFGDTAGGQNTYQFMYDMYERWAKNPGRMKFKIGDRPVADLPVSLKVPESYRARFQVESEPRENSPGPYEWISAVDMARSTWVQPAILNQTDEQFVLGTHLTTGSRHFGDISPYLPFLWIMDKKSAAAAMQRVDAK